MATVLEKVSAFIEARSPDLTCDDCIAGRVGITPRQHANIKTRQLAETRAFDRRQGRCTLCGGDKMVIRSI